MLELLHHAHDPRALQDDCDCKSHQLAGGVRAWQLGQSNETTDPEIPERRAVKAAEHVHAPVDGPQQRRVAHSGTGPWCYSRAASLGKTMVLVQTNLATGSQSAHTVS